MIHKRAKSIGINNVKIRPCDDSAKMILEITRSACVSHFTCHAMKVVSNFPNFCQNKNSLEVLNIIFENSSPKGSFGANKKKFEFSLLSPDSRKLLTTALKVS